MYHDDLSVFMVDNFQLTGSRYMHLKGFTGVTNETDWDFVAEEGDPKIDELLDKFGTIHHSSKGKRAVVPLIDFKLLEASKNNEEYMDTATVAVHKFGEGGKFQLIVKSKELFPTYVKVFGNLSVETYTKYIWKGSGLSREQIQHNIGLLLSYEKGM